MLLVRLSRPADLRADPPRLPFQTPFLTRQAIGNPFELQAPVREAWLALGRSPPGHLCPRVWPRDRVRGCGCPGASRIAARDLQRHQLRPVRRGGWAAVELRTPQIPRPTGRSAATRVLESRTVIRDRRARCPIWMANPVECASVSDGDGRWGKVCRRSVLLDTFQAACRAYTAASETHTQTIHETCQPPAGRGEATVDAQQRLLTSLDTLSCRLPLRGRRTPRPATCMTFPGVGPC